MTATQPLFIMISKTDTGMARFIRIFSRYHYNHVSMTLDPNLRNWCSFARYHLDAPLYGGFVKEPVERFFCNSGDAKVRIFRLDVSSERAHRIEQLFLQAGRKETRLIYNYLDAMASIMDLKIAIANSYTCLSFACAVIGRQFRRIEDLNKALEPNLFYEGSLAKLVPDSGSRDDSYFEPIGFFKGNWHSARQMVLVTFRFLRHRRWDFVDQKLARHR